MIMSTNPCKVGRQHYFGHISYQQLLNWHEKQLQRKLITKQSKGGNTSLVLCHPIHQVEAHNYTQVTAWCNRSNKVTMWRHCCNKVTVWRHYSIGHIETRFSDDTMLDGNFNVDK